MTSLGQAFLKSKAITAKINVSKFNYLVLSLWNTQKGEIVKLAPKPSPAPPKEGGGLFKTIELGEGPNSNSD